MISSLLRRVLDSSKKRAAEVEALVSAGRFEDADRLAGASLLRFPNDAGLMERYAFAAHNSARFALARDRWDQLRACRPTSIMAWAGSASNRRELGDHDAAAELILESLKLFPRNAVLLGEAHRIYLKLKPGPARRDIKSMLAADIDNEQYARAFTLPPGVAGNEAPFRLAAASRPSDIVKALSLLTPFETDGRKVRIGPAGDGGYILLDRLGSGQAVVSYGIGFQNDFEREMSSRGHEVYMFDHTIPPLAFDDPAMHFFSEGLAGTSKPDDRLYSVADHLDRHGIEGDRLILKMGAEGAEFEAFDSMAPDVLARFEQIAIEIHFLDMLDRPLFRDAFLRIFEKINAQFTLFHVHANNGDDPDAFAFIGGLPVPRLLELSYVRTTSIERRPNETVYPTDLDYPCHSARDQRLWIYPFLPAGIGVDALRASWEHTELLGGGFTHASR